MTHQTAATGKARPPLTRWHSCMQAVGKQLKLVDEEAYDLVLMRNEYKVLKALGGSSFTAQ